MSTESKYFSKQARDGIYIPAALIVLGCAIVKMDWVPYAVALALGLVGLKLWRNSKCYSLLVPHDGPITNTICRSAKGSQTK